jgi:HD-GYP domain-containing protein (c-di-GMP phosphodiesterase class II)
LRQKSGSPHYIIKHILPTFAEFGPASYTRKHSFEVASLAKFIADELRLKPKEKNVIVLSGIVHDLSLKDSLKPKRFKSRDFIELAALVHDIGKLSHREVYHKPGPLNEEEWKLVREHPSISAEMIKSLGNDYATAVAETVRHHHERWDGGGYPSGKKGKAIPLASSIIAVADVFNALTTERPYRQYKFTEVEALDYIEKNKNTQFDPRVADAFIKAYRAGRRPSKRESKIVSFLKKELLKYEEKRGKKWKK